MVEFLKSAECAPLFKKIFIEYVVRHQFESLSFGKLRMSIEGIL